MLTTYLGLKMSTRNTRIAEMMMSGSTFTEVASELGIDESRVRTYVIRLRERGIPIPRQKRFKLVATSIIVLSVVVSGIMTILTRLSVNESHRLVSGLSVR